MCCNPDTPPFRTSGFENYFTKPNIMILQLKLASVDYTGGVGAEWEFIVTIDGEEETRKTIGTRLKKGDNPKNRTVLRKYVSDQNSKDIVINVQAKELDKYPDKGMGEMKKTISLKKTEPQSIDVKLDVTEYKGPKVKSNKTGELILHFTATVTGDDDCKAANVVPDIDNARNLEDDAFSEKQEGLTTIVEGNCKIFGCVYPQDDVWRIRVTDATALISWNVNCAAFKDIYLPGESETSLCPEADLLECDDTQKALDDLDTYIAFKQKLIDGQSPATLSPKLLRNASIVAAHEKMHIKDLTETTKDAFKDIKAMLEGPDSVIEAESREDAEAQKDIGLEAAAGVWRDNAIKQAKAHGENSFNQISIDEAKEYQTKIMVYRKEKCGKK